MDTNNLDLIPSFRTVVEFVMVWVIWRGIIVRRLSAYVEKYVVVPLGNWLKRRLIRSRQDFTFYLHQFNKSRNEGHQCKFRDCDDDWCRIV